jgi:hypothetical protein
MGFLLAGIDEGEGEQIRPPNGHFAVESGNMSHSDNILPQKSSAILMGSSWHFFCC